jgi:hypothetical protein
MRGLVGAVVAVGLLVGCGGVEAEEVSPEVEESQDTTQFRACSDEYLIEYFSNSTYTQLIGTERCECWELPVRSGSMSLYKRYVYRTAC